MRRESSRAEWRRPTTGTPEFRALADACRNPRRDLSLRIATTEDEAIEMGGDYWIETRAKPASVLYASDDLADIAQWLRLPKEVAA